MLKESEEELEEMTEEVEMKSNIFSSKESLKSLDGLLNYFEDKEAIKTKGESYCYRWIK